MEIFDFLQRQQDASRKHRDEMWTRYWATHHSSGASSSIDLQPIIARLKTALTQKTYGALAAVVRSLIVDLEQRS